MWLHRDKQGNLTCSILAKKKKKKPDAKKKKNTPETAMDNKTEKAMFFSAKTEKPT